MNKLDFNIHKISSDGKRLSDLLNENDFKFFLRKNGFVPLLKDGRVVVYKIKITDGLYKLIDDLENHLFDVYESAMLSKLVFKSDMCESNSIPFFRNMLGFRACSKSDFLNEFNLNSDIGINEFLNKYAQSLNVQVNDFKLHDEVKMKKLYSIVKKMIDDYITCVFKKPSKLVEYLSFIGSTNYIDFDYCTEFLYEFFYNVKSSFNVNFVDNFDYCKFDKLHFSDKEMSLSDDEKLSIIRNIISCFDFECVFNAELDNLSNEICEKKIESIFGIKTEKIILDCAIHNSIILFSSDFTELYRKVFSFDFTKKIR